VEIASLAVEIASLEVVMSVELAMAF
jgi:hypothetical protein